jgi:diguanylate cyclase (GGDEF)-like protein
MKVLVADNDLVSRVVIQQSVEGLGHQCAVADDEDQAWSLFGDFRPDVLITAWMLPGTTCLDLCRRVRADSDTSYTYIILSTSLVGRNDVLEGLEAGADDYLTRPVDLFVLETRLVAARRVTSLHAELARYRAELAGRASTDPLTQLPNQHTLGEDLRTVHARSQRYRRSYSVVMCDVDWFRAYHETYGHLAGDKALRAVAATLAGDTRQGDGVYRYGSEGFVLVLPEQTETTALIAGERARRAVQDLGMHHAVAPAGVVTVSVGIAAYEPGDDTTADVLLTKAENALYAAKSAGRNRVVCAGHITVTT